MTSENPTYHCNKSYIIKWCITILAPLLISFIPTNEVYTNTIRLFLVITLTIILCIAFELLNLLIPSILLPALYVLSGVAPANLAYGSWTSTLPWSILGAYLLANVLDESGLLKRVSYWCILRTGGSYLGLLYGILTAGLIVSLLASGMGKMVIAILCVGICKAFNLKVSKETGIILLVGAISTITPALFFYNPVGMSLVLTGAQSVIPDLTITWLSFFKANFPYIFFLYFFVYSVYKVFKPKLEFDGKSYFETELQNLGKISLNEKKAFFIVAVLLIFLLTQNFHHIDLNWGFILIPFLAYFPGIHIGSQKAIDTLPYTMVFFATTCVAIGNVAGSLGLGQIISQGLLPILSQVGTTGALMLVCLLGVVLNLLLTPLAILGAFTGPITQIALDLGLNPLGVLYALKSSIDQVFFPYEYVAYLIFFSFGYIRMKDFTAIMGFKTLLHFIFLFAVMIPWWKIIGVL